MKFDVKTLQVLKNFATINPSLMFERGNVIRTISPSKTIMAQATIPFNMESSFAIYDLSQLLSTLALFNEPEVDTEENYLLIASGSEKVKYLFAEPSLIVRPPDRQIVLPTTDISFLLSAEVLQKTMKAMSIMGSPELAVVGDGHDVYLQTYDSKNVNNSNYRNIVGKTDKKFTMVFLAENLKLLPGDYNVDISAKKISHFKGENIEFWIAVEQTSTMN